MAAAERAYNGMAVYGRLLGYSKKYRLVFYIGIVGMMLAAVANGFFVQQVEPLVEEVFTLQSEEALWRVPLLIFIAVVLRALGTIVGTYGMAYVAKSVIRDLRQAIFVKYLVLPGTAHAATRSGESLAKVTFNIGLLSSTAARSVTILIREGLTAIALIYVMCTLSVKLVLVFLAVFPVMFLLVGLGNRSVRRYSKRIQDSMGDIAQGVGEIISAEQLIKVFGGQTQEERRFRKVSDYSRRQELKLAVVKSLVSPFVQVLVGLTLALIVYVAASGLFLDEPMNAGEFMAFFFAFGALFAPLRSLTKVNLEIQQGIAAAQSVFAVLDAEAEQDEGTVALERAQGRLDFVAVCFAYAGAQRRALEQVTLNIQPGQTIALVGQSGSGKSTLANLVPRFYDVSEGSIKLDGVDIRDYHLADLRRQIAYVGQNPTLFDDSIYNNIAYGELAEKPAEAVHQAASLAHALEFIQDKPEGFDALVGENGMQLSGGQRQRIAIARALLKDAPILILDEATSALDAESERHIQTALDNLMQNRTTLIIAHRLSTIENADVIVVLEQGRIIEQGSHAELLNKQGAYAQLQQLQLAGESSD